MGTSLPQRIRETLPGVHDHYYRLVLVVGPAGSGKTAALQDLQVVERWPLFNVGLELSRVLMPLSFRQRARDAADLLEETLRAVPGDPLLLDNLDVLFDPALAVDPLRLLQQLSRRRTLVAAWPGTWDGRTLTHARPGHPEWLQAVEVEALVISAQTQEDAL